MKTQLHTLISIPIASSLGLYSADLAIWFYLAYVLIKSDHVVTYWLSYGKVDLNFKNIYKAFTAFNAEVKKIKYVLPFHSYELVLVLSVFTIVFEYQTYLLGIISGLIFHLFVDFVTLRQILFWGKAMSTFKFYFSSTGFSKTLDLRKYD